ncbi:hypothetical protein [Pseudomonas putida]|uniref:Uncharacterized protein n=1 Tax=Pseudomonas putida TaxID=303 RepID=A0A8I1EAP7_PSEPU|nr:hypothetical protein [Pseudomonas putida]MBI6882477.1 hypothetical protein [Pseudomonas putida]
MSRSHAAPGTPSLGQLIDSVWHRLSETHYLRKIDPSTMACPHEDFLVFGKAILDDCVSYGAVIDTKLANAEYSTWVRFVGAWALFQRKRPMTRNVAAGLMQMDPSNLTNFINGKRALTANALTSFAWLFDIQEFDLKPDLGAKYARNAEKKVAEKLSAVEVRIDVLKADVQHLIDQGNPLDSIMQQIDELKQSVAS